MPNKTKQNTKNSTEQICSQPLYKSQTTHHTHPHPNHSKPRQAMRATTTTSGGRQHGVEREPDSVLIRFKLLCPTQTRTHTHHQQTVINTCEHKKTTNTPTPNKQPQTMTIRIGGVRSGALLQNPDSMPSPKPRPSLPKDKAMPKNEFLTVLLAVPKH